MLSVEELVDRLIDLSFAEDIGDGDHTTLCCIPEENLGRRHWKGNGGKGGVGRTSVGVVCRDGIYARRCQGDGALVAASAPVIAAATIGHDGRGGILTECSIAEKRDARHIVNYD